MINTEILPKERTGKKTAPRILFFSGGTALRKLSRVITRYTHNSIHIITPFDSGGSSAHIRKAFGMLAVGDLRNRLLALANVKSDEISRIHKLLSMRLSKDLDNKNLFQRLYMLKKGTDTLLKNMPEQERSYLTTGLHVFIKNMPENFELKGASIGNLILAGHYLKNERNINAALASFSEIVKPQGIVRAVVNENLHLMAKLDSGETIVGQHLLTGKEVTHLKSAIANLSLIKNCLIPDKYEVELNKETKDLIKSADLICYPMGSFYSSLIANLIPQGVTKAISENNCPKVFIPNSGCDPEQFGISLFKSVNILLKYLIAGHPRGTPVNHFLNYVIVDSTKGRYSKPLNLKKIEEIGVKVIDVTLVSEANYPYFDEKLLVPVILTLAKCGKLPQPKFSMEN